MAYKNKLFKWPLYKGRGMRTKKVVSLKSAISQPAKKSLSPVRSEWDMNCSYMISRKGNSISTDIWQDIKINTIAAQ